MGKKIFLVLVILCVGAVIGGKQYAEGFAEQKLKAKLAKIRDKADVKYGSFSINLIGLKLTLGDVSVKAAKGQHFTAKELTLTNIDVNKAHKFPHFMDVRIKGLSIPVVEANFKEHAPEVLEMGFPEIKADVDLDYDFNPDNKSLSLHTFRIAAENICYLDMRFAFSNLVLEELMKQNYDRVVLDKANFLFTDRALLKNLVAEGKKREPELMGYMREGVLEEIEKARKSGSSDAVRSLEALGAFMASPGRLTVEVKRPNPLPVSALFQNKKISEVLKQFDITIANQ